MQFLVMGLTELRKQLVRLPECFNYKYDPVPGGKRSTVEIPVPIPVAQPYNIVPGNLPKQGDDYQVAERQVQVDRWLGRDFFLTDVEDLSSGIRVLPMAAQSQINSLADFIVTDAYTALYQSSYTTTGTIGQVPFSSAAGGTDSIINARRELKRNRTPMRGGMIKAFLTEEAEAEAQKLRAFQDRSYFGKEGTSIDTGMIPPAFNTMYYCPQVTPDHTAGDASGYLVNTASHSGGINLDPDTGQEVYEVPLDTGTGDFNVGDIFNVAGDSTDYVVRGWNSGTGVLSYFPAPAVSWADNAAVTIALADHRPNVVFHKNAVAFVTRPIQAAIPESLRDKVSIGRAYDELTGIDMTLEITRQYNQCHMEYKVLYGVEAVRPEFVNRMLE